ncbi:hypothetical protein ACHAPT_006440 [Fusarium lateritium]
MPQAEAQVDSRGQDAQPSLTVTEDPAAPAQDFMYTAPSILGRSTLASTEATKFTPPEDLKEEVDVQSESGTASSFGFSDNEGERLRVPPRPQDDDGEPLEQFLCPLCYHLIEAKTTRAWTKHVFRDLQAYVCTFDDCKETDRLFETRQDWLRHEVENHRREWHCNDSDHPIFRSQDEFIDHMRDSHTLQVSEKQLWSSSSIVRRVDEDVSHEISCHDIPKLPEGRFNEDLEADRLEHLRKWAVSLPEEYESLSMDDMKATTPTQSATQQNSHCIVASTKLKRHLGQHLERLALFAINRSKMMADDQKSVSTDNAIPRSESSLVPSAGLGSYSSDEAREDGEEDEDKDVHGISSSRAKELAVEEAYETAEKEAETATIAAIEAKKIQEGRLDERDTNRLNALVKKRAKAAEHAAARSELGSLSLLWESPQPIDFEDVERMNTLMASLEDARVVATKTGQIRRAVIQSLDSPSQRVLGQHVSRAYGGTFEWIFDSTVTRFHDWLLKGDDSFWITGFPGSGKSTLMKFICSHTKTASCLSLWADSKQLALSSYYFSKLGTHNKQSIEDLLRTILFSILENAPHLLTSVCDAKRFPTESTARENIWTGGELRSAIRTFAEMEQSPVKCCVFIDAIDAYPRNPSEITELICELARSPNFKFCISSRPWNIFAHTFGSFEKIIIQDFTRSDIETFVRGRLQEHPASVRTRVSLPRSAVSSISKIKQALQYAPAARCENETETFEVLECFENSISVMAENGNIAVLDDDGDQAPGEQARRLFRRLLPQEIVDDYVEWVKLNSPA